MTNDSVFCSVVLVCTLSVNATICMVMSLLYQHVSGAGSGGEAEADGMAFKPVLPFLSKVLELEP